MPFGAKPQSVDGGRRSQYAQPNHSQPACKLQVRANGRDCPYRQAWLSACPHWQAQQARRPSTQSPKHLTAQPSSASERQDKEAACGPHYGMDSIAHRWYRSGEGPVFARPVLHRSLCVGPSDTMPWSPTIGLLNHTPRVDPAPTWGPSRAIVQYFPNGGSTLQLPPPASSERLRVAPE